MAGFGVPHILSSNSRLRFQSERGHHEQRFVGGCFSLQAKVSQIALEEDEGLAEEEADPEEQARAPGQNCA